MLQVHRLAVLRDNYCFLLEDPDQGRAVVVDPPVVEPVVERLHSLQLTLKAIWITHHHHDHTGGIDGLMKQYGPLPVFASRHDQGRIPHQSEQLEEGDELDFAGEKARVLFVPGHSSGHIAFYFPSSHNVFSGDVVFGASCGKIFEGTPAQMYESVQKIANLPEATRIWCGHEYTLGNLRFASQVEPDNDDLSQRLATVSTPTVPLNVGSERRTNPFMRLDSSAVQSFTGKQEPVEVFARLRQLKDQG